MIEYYSHNKLEDWKTSFLQMTCKSNEQRKLAFYVMTQPLLFKCEKKLTEKFVVPMSQCPNVPK